MATDKDRYRKLLNKKMSVEDYCTKIYELLVEVGESNWSKSFKNFSLKLKQGENENNSVYREIVSIYGGAGSFNDLILYKNGVICKKENDHLSELRHNLYEEIKKEWQ